MNDPLQNQNLNPGELPVDDGRMRKFDGFFCLLSFQGLNSVCFNIVLGMPMVLLARALGASKSYIGLLYGLAPLLSLAQLLIAHKAQYWGYKRVVVTGWAIRTLFVLPILGMCFFVEQIPGKLALAVLFVCVMGFTFVRGLAVAGWFPWLKQLVPDGIRGRTVSLEQMVINLSGMLTLLLVGVLMTEDTSMMRFAIILSVSVVAGVLAALMLARIPGPGPHPDPPPSMSLMRSLQDAWAHPPYRHNIMLSMAITLTFTALVPFSVIFMREELGMGDREVTLLTGCGMLGAVMGSWFWGTLSDKFGVRPTMALATRVLALVMILWLLISLGVIVGQLWILAALSVLYTLGNVGYFVTNLSYVISHMPEKNGASAAAAVNSITSLFMALSPMMWGVVLDLFEWMGGGKGEVFGLATYSSYTLFYGVMFVAMIATKRLIHRLPQSGGVDTHIVIRHVVTQYPMLTFAMFMRMVGRINGNRGADPEK